MTDNKALQLLLKTYGKGRSHKKKEDLLKLAQQVLSKSSPSSTVEIIKEEKELPIPKFVPITVPLMSDKKKFNSVQDFLK